MKKHFVTAFLYTVVTAVLLGIIYPLCITAVAHVFFPVKASGELLTKDGTIVGSRLIGQPFSGPGYFHSRPSSAGTGYDAANSSGSNLGPTSKALADRVQASVATEGLSGAVPIDLITSSGSGLDPDITPASALYQLERVARERKLSPQALQSLVTSNITQRQLGLLGEPRVNVLALNMGLDRLSGQSR